MKLKEKILNDGDRVDFVPYTPNYGVAEFACCPVYRYGKLKEFYIYPRQQENVQFYYKVLFPYPPQDFSIMSWTHKGIDEPRIWIHSWCKEHKRASFSFYVPRNSNNFKIEKLSSFSLAFDRK